MSPPNIKSSTIYISSSSWNEKHKFTKNGWCRSFKISSSFSTFLLAARSMMVRLAMYLRPYKCFVSFFWMMHTWKKLGWKTQLLGKVCSSKQSLSHSKDSIFANERSFVMQLSREKMKLNRRKFTFPNAPRPTERNIWKSCKITKIQTIILQWCCLNRTMQTKKLSTKLTRVILISTYVCRSFVRKVSHTILQKVLIFQGLPSVNSRNEIVFPNRVLSIILLCNKTAYFKCWSNL